MIHFKKTISFVFLVVGFLFTTTLFISCKSTGSSSNNNTPVIIATAVILPNTTLAPNLRGTAEGGVGVMFEQFPDSDVVMLLSIKGIPTSQTKNIDTLRAIHIHWNGSAASTICLPNSTDSGFSKSGTHWNPTNKNHGKWNSAFSSDPDTAHQGDIGNIIVTGDSSAYFIFYAGKNWCIGCSDTTRNILDKAIVLHSGADDYISKFTGNSGNRIGCGIITLQPSTSNLGSRSSSPTNAIGNLLQGTRIYHDKNGRAVTVVNGIPQQYIN